MIELYTAPTPNGWKASVTLEELGMPYETKFVNISGGDQKKPEFLAINPNGRIPAIIDRSANDFAVFESGAIMIYLADKAGKLLPTEARARSLVTQWLMFQMGGVGPMMGQANVFYRYFPEKIQSAIDRYQNESRRLCEVLNSRLESREWLADEFSIADIANWCWVRTHKWSGVEIDGLEHLEAWLQRMAARPGCQRGIEVPFKLPNMENDKDAAKDFQKNAGKIVQK